MEGTLFLLFTEPIILGIGSGAATVAFILFTFGPPVSSPDAGALFKYIYGILKFAQTVLFALILIHLPLFILDGLTPEIDEYSVKLLAIGGIILSGFLMTKRKIAKKYGVVFTAGGWYTYALLHTAVSAGFTFTFLGGVVVYIAIIFSVYAILWMRFFRTR